MRAIDLRLGVAISLLAAAVLWTGQSFPAVPGQKLGAGFLPMLIGAGLLVCGIGLVRRSLLGRAYGDSPTGGASAWRDLFSAGVIVATVLAYIALADTLGFLLIAPLCLVAVFSVLQVRLLTAVLWAIGGTLIVHITFYKLLRVPLPWGILTPLY